MGGVEEDDVCGYSEGSLCSGERGVGGVLDRGWGCGWIWLRRGEWYMDCRLFVGTFMAENGVMVLGMGTCIFKGNGGMACPRFESHIFMFWVSIGVFGYHDCNPVLEA